VERELTLATLTLTTCGAALFASGAVARPGRLWTPPATAAMVFSVLVGWGLQEPDVTDERASPVLGVLALLIAAIWARALVRAVLSALPSRRRMGLACTVGLLRPRVFVDPEVAASLDESELRAVVEHERAHASHRDPLRIWLGQIVTDLQWPLPAATVRWHAWRRELELRRDDDARAAGVQGADLASAILKVARLSRGRGAPGAAFVDGPGFESRITRLLDPVDRVPGRETLQWGRPLFAVSIAVALAAGRAFGEPLVRAVASLH
jgi:hypothetical protein